MESKKIQLYTDRANTIEASPETSANCVILSDGNDLQKVLDNDLTNPTVVHEETSFKVGVGDIDVSSSVVDGEVGRMVIKGQTYQNILPEPSTHVLTNNKEMFKVNEGLDPNVEIVDAVSKSAILSGSTKYQIGEFIQDVYAPVQQFKTGYYLGHNDGTLIQGGNEHKYCEDYIPLPTGVTSITSKGSSNWKKLCCYDSNKNFISGVNGTAGLEDLTLNIPSNAKYFRYSTNTAQGENEYINVVSNTGLLLASSNYNIPCELISCKMPVLQTTGKNLLNIYDTPSMQNYVDYEITGTSIKLTQKAVNTAGKMLSFAIPLKKGETYTYHGYFDNPDRNNIYLRVRDNNSISQFNSVASRETSGYMEFTFTTRVDGLHQVMVYNEVSSSNGGSGIGTVVTWTNVQLEKGTQATSYESFKSNILSTPDEVVLRSFNNVKDTLNLMTGEYVQRIKEMVLNGSETYNSVAYTHNNTNLRFDLPLSDIRTTTYDGLLCDSLPVLTDSMIPEGAHTKSYIAGHADSNRIVVVVEKSKLLSENIEGFRAWLQANPITIQYELKTPIVKTVDLSSSGNWEKRALDGTETNWRIHNAGISTHTCFACELPNLLLQGTVICNEFKADNIWNVYEEKIMTHSTVRQLYLNLDNSRGITTVSKLKEYLSQNPITIWYQTQNHLDSTQVKQPIFFKDGHIQLSSGADNSLIPTLDYQAKTSNSYVMDLMKANTIYTMKNDSANGKFTIDGTQYNLVTNGKLKTPTTLTDKILVINGSASNTMILEGDLTSKTIPYFKGIKSAFEDESKIEVLSTGKNLFDITKIESIIQNNRFKQEVMENTIKIENLGANGAYYSDNINFPILLTEGKTYTLTYDYEKTGNANAKVRFFTMVNGGAKTYVGDDGFTGNFTFKAKSTDVVYMSFYSSTSATSTVGDYVVYKNIQLEESLAKTPYQPYKLNSTKIPLLSPLRSLPNGVCDELIVDRMKKKGTLIKRLDCITFDGSSDENWHTWGSTNSTSHLNNYHYVDGTNNTKNLKVKVDPSWIVSRLGYGGGYSSKKTGATLNSSYFAFSIPKNSIGAGSGDTNSMYEKSGRAWLSQNPITVYYELATPVVTEIDLENFPLVYKDGHIFLNSEIAPMVEINYNVNQSQLIIGNGETLLRHEQEILDLDKLIVSFVDCEYRLRLLKFNMELSMMALAE